MALSCGHFLLVLVSVTLIQTAGSTITCDAPAVSEGEPAFITCQFDRDVTESSTAFAIHKYDGNGEVQDILSCQWINDHHDCETADGYKFNGNATRNATLKIVSATHADTGRYVCQEIPSEPSALTPCNFTLIVTSEEVQDTSLLVILIPCLLAAVVSVAVVVIAVKCCRSKRERRNNESAETRDVESRQPLNVGNNKSRREQPAETRIGLQELNGTTELHRACQAGDASAVQGLLKAKANTDVKDDSGRTPLHVACQIGFENLVKLLLESNANTETKDINGRTPLHVACEYDKASLIRILISFGANTEAKDNEDRTPLHLACQHGNEQIVHMLVERGADIKAKTRSGAKPADLARKNGHKKLAKELKKM